MASPAAMRTDLDRSPRIEMKRTTPRRSLDAVAPREHCLIAVIDVQNDFCAPGGAFDRRGRNLEPIRSMLPRLARFLGRARDLGVAVLFTLHSYDVHRMPADLVERDRRLFGAEGFPAPGSWGEGFPELVHPAPGEGVLVKTRYSAFTNPRFRRLLDSHSTQTLILTGLLTNVCVESTARDVDKTAYNLVVVEDCVASDELALHRASLMNLEQYFGWVVSSSELLAAWESCPEY